MFYWQDVRYAFRLLARQPLFAALTVVVLAGGLGLSIFTFSFLHTAMLKPIPVAGGASVVRLMVTTQDASGVIDAADLAAIRPRITSLTNLGVYTGQEVVVGRDEVTRVLQATATEPRMPMIENNRITITWPQPMGVWARNLK